MFKYAKLTRPTSYGGIHFMTDWWNCPTPWVWTLFVQPKGAFLSNCLDGVRAWRRYAQDQGFALFGHAQFFSPDTDQSYPFPNCSSDFYRRVSPFGPALCCAMTNGLWEGSTTWDNLMTVLDQCVTADGVLSWVKDDLTEKANYVEFWATCFTAGIINFERVRETLRPELLPLERLMEDTASFKPEKWGCFGDAFRWDAPVLEHLFWEGYGDTVQDTSGFENDGSIHSGLLEPVPGYETKTGWQRLPSGKRYFVLLDYFKRITTPDSPSLNVTGYELSFCVWLRFWSHPTAWTWVTFFHKGWKWGFKSDDTPIPRRLWASVYTADDVEHGLKTTERIVPDLKWHFLAVTFNGAKPSKNLKLYLDGKLDKTRDARGKVISTAGSSVEIRGTSPFAHPTWDIFDLRVWNRELTEEEVRGLYDEGKRWILLD